MGLRVNVCSSCFSLILIGHVTVWIYICFGTSMFNQRISHNHIEVREAYDTNTLRSAVFKDGNPSGQNKNSVNYLAGPSIKTGLGDGKIEGIFGKDLKSRLLKPMVVGRESDHKFEHNTEQQPSNMKDLNNYYNVELGHTILHRDPSLVLNGHFLNNPIHLCSQHNDLDLVVLVHTSPYHFQRRKRLRRVFSDPNTIHPYTVQLVFVIGKTAQDKIEDDQEETLDAEISKHGDFVQMNFVENFRNLSLKATTWLRWTSEFCPNAQMVLKIDDDVILDLRRVLPLSRGLFSKYKRSLFCNLNKVGSQPIPRIGRTKVDPREFADNKYYPYNYCSGFIVFLSQDLIPVLAKAIRKTPFYNVDDVFMFGMVPKVAGNVLYHNIGFNVSIWHSKVYNCTVQKGTQCQYFTTMAEKLEDSDRMYKAFDQAYIKDFHFPRITVL